MPTPDQHRAIDWLMDPAAHGGVVPEHVETHAAHVFLAGDRAYKIKRAVAYDYLDFSTLAARERMLRRELELNRPAAPEIYEDLVALTQGVDGLEWDGAGPVVEWVLRMRRFPSDQEMSAVAERGALSAPLAEALGHAVARYHAQAPKRWDDGARLMAAIVDELDRAFAGMTQALGAEPVSVFVSRCQAALDRVAPLLTDRSARGHVRRCHGDLHLRNMVLIDGRPVPFDALEFDEVLGTCDVLYDTAFLVMDLLHRDLPDAANLALNAWLFDLDGAEDAGLAALPLFLAVRAGIRAMVDVQTGRAAHHEAEENAEARRYLALAVRALAPSAPRLVAVAGMSGTGKTTLARLLAPGLGALPGAVHLRSDLERKRLAGVDPLTRLPVAAYTPQATADVYARLIARAETILATGHSVILDATYLDPKARLAVEDCARRAGADFTGLWLDAPGQTLQARVAARRGDASDADAGVVARQGARDIGSIGWTRLNAGQALDDLEASARRVLDQSNQASQPD